MGLHAYCIVPGSAEPPAGVAGIDGEPVRAVAAAGLACWVSSHEARPAAMPRTIAAHHVVASRPLQRGVTPVPLRFGQWFGDEPGAAAALEAAAGQWEQALRHVAGCVEFALSVTRMPATAADDHPAGVRPPAGHRSTPTPGAARDVQELASQTGTAWMATLARRHADAARRRDEAGELAAAIRSRAGSLVRDARVRALDGTAGIASLAHLVDSAATEEYRLMIEDLRRTRGDLRFVISGPWPPYSFVA